MRSASASALRSAPVRADHDHPAASASRVTVVSQAPSSGSMWPDALRQGAADRRVARFLIAGQERTRPLERTRRFGRQPDRPQQGDETIGGKARHQARFDHHADRDGVAVGRGVLGGMLDRMGGGVPEVEDVAFAAIAVVLGHDIGLDLHTARDHVLAVLAGFDRREQRLVGEHRMLDRLGEAVLRLHLRQRRERSHVEVARPVDGGWRRSRFFPRGGVDRGLAADPQAST